jgi:hypothetical protein
VCSYCNGSYAYRVSKQTASNVELFSKEEQAQVQEVIDDFQEYLQSAEYVAVASGNDTCVAAYNIQEDVDVHAMYENFTGTAYPDISSIGLFDLTEDELNITYIGVKYDGDDYSNFTVVSKANETGTAGDRVTFHCTQVSLEETEDGADVEYSGTVYYSSGNTTYSASFNIASSEYQETGDYTTMSVDVEGNYTYKQWTDIVDSQANCSSVSRPSNMSSLDDLAITHAVLLVMTKEDGASEVTQVDSYFESVGFSGGYGFYLVSNEGKAVIRTANHTCYNAFVGNWTAGNMTYSATYLNKETDYYYAEARLQDHGNLTIKEVQDNLVETLFLDPMLIFPEYEAKQSAVGSVLWRTVIRDPFVKLLFDGEVKLKVEGEGELVDVDSQIEVRVSRVEGTVTGVTTIYQVEGPVLLEDDPSFERREQHVIVASCAVDFEEYPYMQSSQGKNFSYVDVGYWYEVTLLLNDNCTSSNFCRLVKQSLEEDTDTLVLRGADESDSTYLVTELNVIELESGLKFKEDALVYDFANAHIFIVGASTIRGDSVEVLRFIGNITNEESQSHFKVMTEEFWTSAFDIEAMNVSVLAIEGYLTEDLDIDDSKACGQVVLGTDCDLKDCLAGEITVVLNYSDYVNNYFQARFENATALEFFNSFANYNFSEEVPYQLSILDPSDGFSLSYAYPNNTVSDLKGYSLKGNVTYLGVPSEMQGYMETLNSGVLELAFEMSDITAGAGNIKVKNPSATLLTDHAKFTITEEVRGVLSFAYLSDDDAVLSVTEDGIYSKLQGKVYGGLYEAKVELSSANETDIETAKFTGDFVIQEAELADLEEYVRSDLYDWVETGLKALNQSRGWVKEAMEPVKQLEPNLCVENVACGNRLECSQRSGIVCAQQNTKSECVAEGASCKSVALECSESETICSVEKADCEGEECCEVSVTVCHEWSESCTDTTNDNCKAYEIAYDSESCDRDELSCEPEEVADQSCVKRCQRTEYLYDRAYDNYQTEQAGYNQTQVDLQGFRSMRDIEQRDFEASKLIEVRPRQFIEVTAHCTLNETGIGPLDWTFRVVGRVLDLVTEDLEDFTATVKWDLFDHEHNRLSLLEVAKEAIISRSGAELSEALATESPFELIESNRVS